MFCQNCGTQIADDAAFCTSCGTATAAGAQPQQAPVQQAPVYTQPPVYTQAPVTPAQPNPMFSKFLVAIVDFWKSPTTFIGTSAKSDTHEWSLLAAVSIVLYALSNAVVGLESFGGYSYPFLAMLGVGILVGAAAYGLTSLGVWVVVGQIFKKRITYVQGLNMTAVAFLPLAAVQIVNMIAGLIDGSVVTMLTTSALIMTAMLVYIGMQKFEKLEKSPFYAFSIMAACVVIAVSLISLLYGEVMASAYVVSGVESIFGGMFDYYY